jgi:hypothetical protein
MATLHETENTVDAASPSDSSGTANEKLQHLVAATQSRSSQIMRESETYLAIEALSAEDFRQLAADGSILVELSKKIGGAFTVNGPLASALISRWMAVDPDRMMAGASHLLDLLPKENLRTCLLNALAAKRPADLLTLVPSQKDAAGRQEIIACALRELAARDLPKAREWLARCTDATDRRAAEKAVRAGMVQADPLQAVALAGSLEDRKESSDLLLAAATQAAKMGAGVLRQFATIPMQSWMIPHVMRVLEEREPQLAVDLIVNSHLEGSEASYSLNRAFSALSRRDPATAIAKLDGLAGVQLSLAVSAIGYEWGGREPAAALAWLMERPAAERQNSGARYNDSRDPVVRIFSDWARSGQTDARTWADALPAGATRDAVQAELANVLAERGQTADAMQVLARMGRAASPKAIADVVGAWTLRDPQAAADWAIAQPAGPGQSRALASVAAKWASDNPAGVRDWLAQFPPGDARDLSVAAYLARPAAWSTDYASLVAEFDQWFGSIEDPWVRAGAAVNSFWARRQRDPAAARAWLSAVPNVDPEVIRITLRNDRS